MDSTLGFIHLPDDSEWVSDADEEVFLLYTDLQSRPAASHADTDFRGLGYMNSRADLLEIQLELFPPETDRNDRKTGKSRHKLEPKVIEVQLAQDKTSLHSRKGDTGSVLWKASIDFARLILQQCLFPLRPNGALFDPAILKELNVLELGSGTGFLGIALLPLVRSYVSTDIAPLLPLMEKNVTLNVLGDLQPRISVEELDWLALLSTNPHLRPRFFSPSCPPDLLLVVDCIYHPSLLPALVESIDFLTLPDKTTVLVVVELRAEDVVREFLHLWIAKSNWRVVRLGRQAGLECPYVIWAGVKTAHLSVQVQQTN